MCMSGERAFRGRGNRQDKGDSVPGVPEDQQGRGCGSGSEGGRPEWEAGEEGGVRQGATEGLHGDLTRLDFGFSSIPLSDGFVL